MPKVLKNNTMHSSKLKSIYSKCRTEENCWNYKKQTHFCVNLLRETKAENFQKPNVKDLPDHKKFWKTMKPYFSNKGCKNVEKNNNRLIAEEKE